MPGLVQLYHSSCSNIPTCNPHSFRV
uniref:Uncharacterized protein n=1 Tax=Solanum lycopersicum TaxID=4081 RepID=A0A3Q7F9X7_SOLLC